MYIISILRHRIRFQIIQRGRDRLIRNCDKVKNKNANLPIFKILFSKGVLHFYFNVHFLDFITIFLCFQKLGEGSSFKIQFFIYLRKMSAAMLSALFYNIFKFRCKSSILLGKNYSSVKRNQIEIPSFRFKRPSFAGRLALRVRNRFVEAIQKTSSC